MEGRAAKNYKYFVDTFILYQTLFENCGDPQSLLSLPYPLYNDIILRQIDEKKREKKILDQKMSQMNNNKQQKKPPQMKR